MIAGSMFIRSSTEWLKVDTGYDTKHVVSLNLQFPEGAKYPAARRVDIVSELRARLTALPSVAGVTSANPPAGGVVRLAAVSLNGEHPSASHAPAVLYYTYVQSNYFQTLGIPLLRGRTFPPESSPLEHSVILSESAAQRLWPRQNPIGRTLRLGTGEQFHAKGEILPDGPSYQVIGISRDTRGFEFDGNDSKQIYVPLPDDRLQDYSILIRTRSDPTRVKNAISPITSSVDPNLVASSSTLDAFLHQTPPFITSNLAAAVSSTVGLLGLALALMGIYGTVSYIVVLRTREVGIRMAIGAQKRDILRLMLVDSSRPVFVGVAAGASLAVGVSYLLRNALFGVHRVDAISFFGVSVLFLSVAVLAAYPPSRRAMRVDPMVALRYE
jgi:predicted permease